jgi:hypothetical protein
LPELIACIGQAFSSQGGIWIGPVRALFANSSYIQELIRVAYFGLACLFVAVREFTLGTHCALSDHVDISIWLAFEGAFVLGISHDIIAAFRVEFLGYL